MALRASSSVSWLLLAYAALVGGFFLVSGLLPPMWSDELSYLRLAYWPPARVALFSCFFLWCSSLFKSEIPGRPLTSLTLAVLAINGANFIDDYGSSVLGLSTLNANLNAEFRS